jgi:hypothetical protein
VSAYRFSWNETRQCWDVFATGEFARFVRSFPTLLDAETYATRGEAAACPDFVEDPS